MKKSRDWVRQEDLDKKLDALVEDIGAIPPGMRPYEVAERLGLTANGEFYRKFRDWKQRREAEADLPALEIPPSVKADLQTVLDQTTDDVLDLFIRTVRGVAGDLDRTAELRVKDAERRAAEARAETEELLDRWTETERERDAALDRTARAEAEAKELRRDVDRLRGRLEERQALLETLRGEKTGSEVRPAAGAAARLDRIALERLKAQESGGSQDKAEGVSDAAAGLSSTVGGVYLSQPNPGPRGPGQSSTNETDGLQVHQAELSLVETDNAGTAEADDDDHD